MRPALVNYNNSQPVNLPNAELLHRAKSRKKERINHKKLILRVGQMAGKDTDENYRRDKITQTTNFARMFNERRAMNKCDMRKTSDVWQ
jgi:hypothetical protein